MIAYSFRLCMEVCTSTVSIFSARSRYAFSYDYYESFNNVQIIGEGTERYPKSTVKFGDPEEKRSSSISEIRLLDMRTLSVKI